MRWVWSVATAIAVLALLVLLFGSLLPRRFSVTRAIVFHRPAAEVWKVVTDVPAIPSWRPGVVKIEPGPDRNGRPTWVETFRNNMKISVADTVTTPGHVFEREIFGEGVPFTGRWTFDLSAHEGGCRLVLTEDGDVPNVFFRFVSKFVMGHVAHVDRYLLDLARKFGEEAKPVTP